MSAKKGIGGRNRRQFVRKLVSMDAIVIPEDGESFQAPLRDMSVGGAFVVMPDCPPFGSHVHLELALRESSVRIPAVIRWVSADGMGVQFDRLGAKVTYAITEYLATCEEAPDSRDDLA